MGNRANILVKESVDGGVYLYTHSDGDNVPFVLKSVLRRRVRWDDTQYLTRIIFDELTMGHRGDETGYGISSFVGDGSDRVLMVDIKNQCVMRGDSCLDVNISFEDYIKTSIKEIKKLLEW